MDTSGPDVIRKNEASESTWMLGRPTAYGGVLETSAYLVLALDLATDQ